MKKINAIDLRLSSDPFKSAEVYEKWRENLRARQAQKKKEKLEAERKELERKKLGR